MSDTPLQRKKLAHTALDQNAVTIVLVCVRDCWITHNDLLCLWHYSVCCQHRQLQGWGIAKWLLLHLFFGKLYEEKQKNWVGVENIILLLSPENIPLETEHVFWVVFCTSAL